MAGVGHSLLSELDVALAETSKSKQSVMLRRLTDLFVDGAATYSDDHVSLFGDVIGRMITGSDRPALIDLSERLVQVGNAPTSVVCLLSRNDDIRISGPLLAGFATLPDADLAEIAKKKGRPHLLAIARRAHVSEYITDALIDRADIEVVQKLADNGGARFSELGYVRLIKMAKEHTELAVSLSSRRDVPPELEPFLKLTQS